MAPMTSGERLKARTRLDQMSAPGVTGSSYYGPSIPAIESRARRRLMVMAVFVVIIVVLVLLLPG